MNTTTPTHSWLAHWLGADGVAVARGDTRALRGALAGHGVSAKGVRLYLDYGDRLFAPLGPVWIRRDDRSLSLKSAIAWLRLLQACEMDIAPPPMFAAAMVSCCRAPRGLDSLPVPLFRAAWRGFTQASYGGVPADRFIVEELQPVVRWALHREATNGFDANQIRQGWAWLRKAWHDEQRRRALPPPGQEWSPTSYDGIFKGVRLIPLTSRAALLEEGEVMNHCIADYFSPSTLGDRAQVLSARRPDTLDRLATVALRRKPHGEWEVDDIKAQANRAATPAVHESAQALLGWINARLRRNEEIRQ